MTEFPGSFTVDDLKIVTSVCALVLIVSVASVRLATRTGLPSLLLYLLLGLVLGEAGLGIRYEEMGLSLVLGYVALILILAEGGLTTSWPDIRPAVIPAALLSTLGVTVSVLVVAAAAHQLLGLDWHVSMLVGAILTSTDAAAVFSVLRNVRPNRRLSGILEAESGFNDAPVVLIVVYLAVHLNPAEPEQSLGVILLTIAAELIGGALIGLAIGFAGAWVMRFLGSSASGLFPIGVMAWVMLSYGLASIAHTSGFIAVYLSALVLGNIALPHRGTTRGFAQALGWLAQIGLFVMLGLLASPSDMLSQIVPAIVLGLVLLLIARPLSVLASMVWFRMPINEQLFLSWAGLRGAVPIVLASMPIVIGAAGVDWIFNLVFVLVIVFTLVQGPTLPWVARRLRVVDTQHARNVEIESTPLEDLGADLLEISIGSESRLHGVEVVELRLPEGTEISLVVRDGTPFVPAPHTVLHHGDALLLVVPVTLRAKVDRRLHEVDRHGRLAGWTAGRQRPRTPRSAADRDR